MLRVANVSRRGFTLIELMTVVVIMGILATLATYGVRKYIFTSKTAEAIHMIGSIKSAEESYRSETFKYAGKTSVIDNAANFYPQGRKPGKYKADWTNTSHPDYASVWGPLGVQSDSPVIFEYVIEAGGSSGTLPVPGEAKDFSWGAQGAKPPGPWYVVAARADQNEDGTMSCFFSSSLTGEIFRFNEDE